jgi:hypothetical protein
MERRGFLKTVLAGLAAAPVVASANTTSYREVDDVRVKKWKHGEIEFAEWTLPASVPPHFKEKDDKALSEALFSGEVLGPTRLRVPKRIVIPVFDMKTDTQESMKQLVKRVIQAFSDNESRLFNVKDENGNRRERLDPKHFVVVRVQGRPRLVGLAALHYEVVPVDDFYEGLDKDPDIEKS